MCGLKKTLFETKNVPQKLPFYCIEIPSLLDVSVESSFLLIEGPLGTIRIDMLKEDPLGLCTYEFLSKEKIAFHYLSSVYLKKYSESFLFAYIKQIHRNILEAFLGVSRGYSIYLQINGVGYKAECIKKTMTDGKGMNELLLKLGHSHDITYEIPNDIEIFCVKPTYLCVFGINKQKVTQAASYIRNLKPVEIYKGKGIRYVDELVVLKEGKKK